MVDSVKANLKLTGISVAVILVLIVILQNTEPVVTSILWLKIEMPRALLLFMTFAAGFGCGYLFYFLRAKKEKSKGDEAPAEETPAEQ